MQGECSGEIHVSLSVCLSVRVPFYMCSLYLSFCLFMSVSVYLCLSVCVCLPVCLPHFPSLPPKHIYNISLHSPTTLSPSTLPPSPSPSHFPFPLPPPFPDSLPLPKPQNDSLEQVLRSTTLIFVELPL